jgi:type III secretion system YscI/HrpB-like protein
MSPLTTVVLDPVVTTRATSLGEATKGAESLKQRVAAFDDALSRQSVAAPVQPNMQVAQATNAPTATQQVPPVESRELTRRALDLETVKDPARATGGDLILDGLRKLRGTFDTRHSKVAELMRTTSNVDASMLMAMQVEVANYTLTVDVTSKLTGKSTQSFDTLMKGQ